jgi:phosphate ABC transporter phosphate-binding protein
MKMSVCGRIPRPAKLLWRLWLAVVILALTASGLQAQMAQVISQAKKLYLEPFQGEDGNILRAALIKQLQKEKTFQLVDSEADADVVIEGSGEIWIRGYVTTNSRAPSMNTRAVMGGYLSVKVIGRDRRPLWSYTVLPDRLIWTSVADDLARNTAKAMVGAVEAAGSALTFPLAAGLPKAMLTGSGATFPAPLYRLWFQSFHERNPAVNLEYREVGSEAGLQMLARGEVDFAASDVASPEILNAKLGTGYWRVPVVLGGVVPIFNLPHVTSDLKFTGEVLSDIYLGRIKRWNDPEIRKINRDANLPDAGIVVVHRSDGSGTTYALTDYLSAVDQEWRQSKGTSFRPEWGVGVGAEGNEGVASKVEHTPNAIGYVEMVYAIQHDLPFASVRNSSGLFIKANIASVEEAANAFQGTGDISGADSIVNPPSKGAYPIATFSWILVPQRNEDAGKKRAVIELLRWMLSDGQKECSVLGYTPLPAKVAEHQLEFLSTLR